ncbi:hypothetical protein T459_08023 [Capsicum annuum]|uniref:Ubiquitin-like protease family profile domain-containing protein n=1 Tax=Capsicum annuum TaxID=4072 RepID=A0A2G2ZVB7_CAPAN|nr:hypothetical protein T459_08023 [Capsicum annuum]
MVGVDSFVMKDVPLHSMVTRISTKVIGYVDEQGPSLNMKHDKDKGPAGEITNDKPLVLQHLEMDIQASVYTHTEYPTTIAGQNNQKHAEKDKGPVVEITNDEPAVLQPVKTNIQACVYTHTECPTTIDGQSDQKDDVGDTITDLVQDVGDTLLFGLSTPSTTKPLNEGTLNTMIESQWMIPDSQYSPDFSDAQVSHKSTYKRGLKEVEDFKVTIERTDWSTLEAYKGKLGRQTGLISQNPFDIDYVQNIPQQASDILDCGVFVAAYAEILSEGQQVHSFGFDVGSQHGRYASLL